MTVNFKRLLQNTIEKTRENKDCDFKSILSSHPAISQNKKNHDHQRISDHPSYDGRGVPSSAIVQCGGSEQKRNR